MDIKEIKEEKKKAEDEILSLIQNFSTKTGLFIEDINFERIGEFGFTRYISVSLDIKV